MGSSDHVTGTQGQIIYAIRSKIKPCEQLLPFNTEPGVPIDTLGPQVPLPVTTKQKSASEFRT